MRFIFLIKVFSICYLFIRIQNLYQTILSISEKYDLTSIFSGIVLEILIFVMIILVNDEFQNK